MKYPHRFSRKRLVLAISAALAFSSSLYAVIFPTFAATLYDKSQWRFRGG